MTLKSDKKEGFMEFHFILCKLRAQKGVTQNQAAKALEITPRQYQRFESGEQKPGFDNLRKIADYFNVSTDYLVGRTDEP